MLFKARAGKSSYCPGGGFHCGAFICVCKTCFTNWFLKLRPCSIFIVPIYGCSVYVHISLHDLYLPSRTSAVSKSFPEGSCFTSFHLGLIQTPIQFQTWNCLLLGWELVPITSWIIHKELFVSKEHSARCWISSVTDVFATVTVHNRCRNRWSEKCLQRCLLVYVLFSPLLILTLER